MASTRRSRRSGPTLPHSLRFDAIGTGWEIETELALDPELEAAIMARIDAFDRTWSRFRSDSLVARIAAAPGVWEFPDDAPALFDLYRRLYIATDGAMSPLVGSALESLGYDREYTLRPSGQPVRVLDWDDVIAWDGQVLTTVRPLLLDVGAAGKGYLVDLIAEILTRAGHREFTVDGSGDIRHAGVAPIRVGLEHPLDPTKAIGIARVRDGAICSSATNRRAWGDGLHHVLDATTGVPTTRVIATWAIAATALEADGLSTALFFADPGRLATEFDFTFVRMSSAGRVEFSPELPGEIFA